MLYIIATPIGNLEDITLRALNILKTVDFILCEDTRTTSILLNHYEIKNKLVSYHQHSNEQKHDSIIQDLLDGKNIALVTDAGTPCISDPGYLLISKLREEYKDIEVVPIPGPSAMISALSVSGFNLASFTFLGFIPNKNGREKFVKGIINNTESVSCFYESCYRIEKCLETLSKFLKEENQENRKIFVVREMTKMFESYYYGTIEEVTKLLKSDKIKGEFVVIVDKFNKKLSK